MSDLDALRATWEAAWEPALDCWSPFTRLRRPTWCLTEEDEQREGLTGSFAMIRLTDKAVCISLRQVAEKGIGAFAREVLAHEIGHHVLAPGDLSRHARSLAHIRLGLPSVEHLSPMVANLYTDLLINDRLQRQMGLDRAGVWRALAAGEALGAFWTLYLRTYEVRGGLQSGTLARGPRTPRLDADAVLAARVIRVYGRDWIDGAGRFAALCLPYLLDEVEEATRAFRAWLDTTSAGQGGFPAGLSEVSAGEREGAIHPAFDPLISGISAEDARKILAGEGGGVATIGGQKSEKTYRGPVEYGDLLRLAGIAVTESEAAVRYYRERAVPHLVPFPSRVTSRSTDPLPEGLETWEVGDPLHAADWVETVFRSPHVIPGMTTVQRSYGTEEGVSPERQPVDLYVGIDCSGSMPNPRRQVSFPAIAGAVVCLSALRAGASVDVVLSGEPGQSVGLGGPTRDESRVLALLTAYLGPGYAFGVHRLAETFGPDAPARDRPMHILLLSDSDLFLMLEATEEGAQKPYGQRASGKGPLGWDVAEAALAAAGGGGTIVLDLPPTSHPEPVERLRQQGWDVHFVREQAELVGFARAFARAVYATERAEA